MIHNSRPYIGGHVSTAGGVFNAFVNAEKIGAETIQIFGASPRRWLVGRLSAGAITEYKKFQKESQVKSVYLHGAYLPNLASPNKNIFAKSVENLRAHFEIANRLEAQGLIFHVGSGKERSKDESMKQAIEAMKEILEAEEGPSYLIMENSASGKKIGAWPEEMRIMMEGINSPRIKICIDTAHAFEAGLIESYTPENIKKFFDEWDKAVGINNIVAFHVNDSKTAFNSHHDRHENIGQGYIGLEGFKNFAKEKRTWDKDWLLEVPGFDNQGPDKENIEILKSLFNA
ncbi:MAG: deoxyribonuclease IV [Candidatus Yanofskybacteria bacterium]|nr:deoxyribonuclease IV [Candidatus Yanofskybacteria bacterium]